jgi:hypothetical protein
VTALTVLGRLAATWVAVRTTPLTAEAAGGAGTGTAGLVLGAVLATTAGALIAGTVGAGVLAAVAALLVPLAACAAGAG